FLSNTAPDNYDKKVMCTFKNLNSTIAIIINNNLSSMVKMLVDFSGSPYVTTDGIYSVDCNRQQANTIRNLLAEILTTQHLHVWFTISTRPLDGLCGWFDRLSSVFQVLYSFGSMYSYSIFYDHTQSTTIAHRLSVKKDGRKQTVGIQLEIQHYRIFVPLNTIKKEILVKYGNNEKNAVEMIFMLKSAVQIFNVSGKLMQRNCYGMEILYSLGYLFQDKYFNSKFRSLVESTNPHFYDLCDLISSKLQNDHCYNIDSDLQSITRKQTGPEAVQYAVLTPLRLQFLTKNQIRGNFILTWLSISR
ncbi:unnamed protein product, partial [Didymodactylos carnosus]